MDQPGVLLPGTAVISSSDCSRDCWHTRMKSIYEVMSLNIISYLNVSQLSFV